jgi:hypothetical protein
MAQLIDLVGNTLVVSDIQIAASGAMPGTGVTGTSLSSTNFVTESLTGQQKVQTGVTTTTGGATTAAILIGADGIGIFFGTGVPSITAVTGSLYLNKGGSSVSTRLYVNTTGASTWTAVTTLA